MYKRKENFTLYRVYCALASVVTSALILMKCKRRPPAEDESGAGDRSGPPTPRALVPVHNCGASCPSCPHLTTQASKIHDLYTYVTSVKVKRAEHNLTSYPFYNCC